MEKETLQPLFSPGALSALYSLAYTAYQKGCYREALSYFHMMTSSALHDRRGWMGVGACHQMLREYDDAIAAYGQAALLDPDDPYAHFHAAECFHAKGERSTALDALKSALASNPKEELKIQLRLIKQQWTQGGTHACN